MINKIQELSFEFMILKKVFYPKEYHQNESMLMKKMVYALGFFFHKLNI